jgi:vacuolar iron transporter family protein
MKQLIPPTRFSFGSTSAIITNLALVWGLDTMTSAKASIIGGILVIALADNASDTLGIHMHREAETVTEREILLSTVINYSMRFLVSMVFALIVLFFPIAMAVVLSTVYGFTVLSVVSFIIARKRKTNPYKAIIQHITIATIVILISKILGNLIISAWGK